MTGDVDPTTEELRLEQLGVERTMREQAGRAPDDDEADQYEARAAKARYLREKLEERAEAERATD
jgi:hypothetical protein